MTHLATATAAPDRTHELKPASRGNRTLRTSAAAFIGQFLKAPTQVGAIAPSGSHLADEMVSGIHLDKADVVVEYGPGTGSFTGHILAATRPEAKVFAIELNPAMARASRERYPRLALCEGSVTEVARFCTEQGVGLPRLDGHAARAFTPGAGVDAIVSGLPWAIFPEALQRQILSATVRVLKPGGVLATFAYTLGLHTPAGKRFHAMLPEYFARVERSRVVWRNFPPALVVRCWR